jgi:predicted ATPase/DNA-binding XRE family transcriptional regulator
MGQRDATPFGVVLRRFRTAARLTQEELAARASLSPDAIAALERGKRRTPRRATVELLATALALDDAAHAEFLAAGRASVSTLGANKVGNASGVGSPTSRCSLPLEPTALVDRTSELDTILQRLTVEDVRLLTLTGPGGVGKTRLALAAAARLAEDPSHFPDGIVVVDLTPVRDPDLVLGVIAGALGLLDVGSRPILERLVDTLADRRLLLALDNFEQVLPAAASLADLLAACPTLALLVTSRAPLRLRWEQTLRVAPLPIPDLSATLPPPDALLAVPSVELFVRRARAHRADFVLTEQQAPLVAQLVAQLDGLPLALELAAARLDVLSLPTLARRLDDRMQLLASQAPDRPERQQSLEAAVGWSYDLLSEPERRLFRCLGVFVGRVSLDAITAVVGAVSAARPEATDGEDRDTGSALSRLLSLAEKSLVLPVQPAALGEPCWQRKEGELAESEETEYDDSEPAFGMLETVREYARQCQEKAGAQGLAHRHARFYSRALDRNREDVYVRRAESLAWFDAEEDNLRAMLDHASEEDRDDAALAVFQLTRFWVPRGRYAEAHQRLRALLAEGDLSEDARALVLTSLAEVEEWLGHLQEAEAAAREAVLLGEASGQARVLAEALHNLAWVTFRQGDAEEAVTIEERAMTIVASVDEQKRLLALHDLGGFQMAAGRVEEAREALRAAIDGARAIGYATLEVDGAIALAEMDLRTRDFASAYQGLHSALARKRRIDPTTPERGLLGLGWAALGVDRRREARVAFGEVIELLVDAARTSHYEFALATAGMAFAAEAKDARPAARLRGASVRLHEVGEFTPPADDLDLVSFFERRLIDMLRAEALAEEQAEGTAMSLDEAIELARSLADT